YIDSAGKRTNRWVEPYSLVLKGQKWYLYAWCLTRQAFRLFKLSRIRELEADGTVFQPREVSMETLDLDDPWNSAENMVTLRLVFEKEMDSIVTDWFGEDVERLEGGKLLVSTSLPENNWLYGFILSFGNGVEVVEPVHIRKILAGIAGEIYARYSNGR
ncbi:MAG TPA: WYL domain-containing protein, partial [Negativicutes bacterium]|nr:WYL domain-containing protein [Negativicutes bacterium]